MRLGLFDAEGRIVNDTTTSFVIWPRLTTAAPRVALVSRQGPAEKLAQDVEATIDPAADVILADRLPAAAADRNRLWKRVRAGATLILTELSPGRHRIGSEVIEVKPCGFAPYDFVSRATGHPLVAGFSPEDFRFWHDAATDAITPLLNATFQAPGWKPILVSGEAGWGVPDCPALAAAERPLGQGRIILSLLSLSGRAQTNPAAALLAQRLLEVKVQGEPDTGHA